MELALPSAVRAALRAHGVEPSSPLGVGAAGLRWSALGADGRRYAVVHATGSLAVSLRSRADALTAVRHPSLARCAQILTPDDGVVVLVEADPGTDLGVLLEARGRLAPGEVVGLLAPVAEALAALHEAGMAHGDVAPANIVVTDGRPVLVDILAGADVGERGTPGFIPPGRDDGPSPAADVASLGLVGRALLGAGTPGLATGATGASWAVEPADVDRLRRAVLTVCDLAASPAVDRPTALDLAAALRRACPVAPLEPADPAVLARLGLRRLSGADEATSRAAFTVRATGTSRRRDGRHRSRSPGARRVRRAAGLGTALLSATVVIVIALMSGQETASDAAVRLTQERASALMSGDGAALAEVTVPGSAAALADQTALLAVTSAASRPSSPPSEPSWHLDVVAEGIVPCEGPVTCVSIRTVTSRGGVRGAERRVVLMLEPGPWRVLEVSDAG